MQQSMDAIVECVRRGISETFQLLKLEETASIPYENEKRDPQSLPRSSFLVDIKLSVFSNHPSCCTPSGITYIVVRLQLGVLIAKNRTPTDALQSFQLFRHNFCGRQFAFANHAPSLGRTTQGARIWSERKPLTLGIIFRIDVSVVEVRIEKIDIRKKYAEVEVS
jgi:hypothetical protein